MSFCRVSLRAFHCARGPLLGVKREESYRRMSRQLTRLLDKKFNESYGKKKGRNSAKGHARPVQHQRSLHLSAVLHDRISELINSGCVANDLNSLGFEINTVTILPDMSCIRIHWIPTFLNDEKIEDLLVKVALDLRRELSNIRVMGSVPPIQFIKDKKTAYVQEVAALLAKADFGPDFVPTDPADAFRVQPKVEITQMQNSLQEKLSHVTQTLERHDSSEQSPGCTSVRGDIQDDEGKKAHHQADENMNNDHRTAHNLKNLKMRFDLFGVDRNALHKKVVQNKGRMSQGSPAEDLEFPSRVSNVMSMQINKKVSKIAQRKMKEKEKAINGRTGNDTSYVEEERLVDDEAEYDSDDEYYDDEDELLSEYMDDDDDDDMYDEN